MRFMSKRAKDRKKQYVEQATKQWNNNVLTGEIDVYIKLYFGDKRKRDWDNYHKLSMDALTGIVWEDDSQIQMANVQKFYDKTFPRIEISVNYIKF